MFSKFKLDTHSCPRSIIALPSIVKLSILIKCTEDGSKAEMSLICHSPPMRFQERD